MKKTLLLSSLFIAFWGCIKAQSVTFQKTIWNGLIDKGCSIQKTNDGGYVLCGISYPLVYPMPKVYVVKFNSAGDTLWTNIFFYTMENIIIESIQQSNDDGFILVGRQHWTNPYSGDDTFFLKLSANGDFQWRNLFSRGYLNSFGNCVLQSSDGYYAISGKTIISPSSGRGYDAYLVKINGIGDTVWTKSYGGTGDDSGKSLIQTSDGGYLLAGCTNSFGADSLDVLIARTNSNGDTLWSKRYGGMDNDWGNSIQQTNNGGFIIAGTTQSFGAGNKDVYLIRTDATGHAVWSKTYGGEGDEEGNSVQLTNDGGYIIAGSTTSFGIGSSDAYLIKIDSLGNLIWSKTFGNSDEDKAMDIKQTIDSGYVVTGVHGDGGGYSSVLLLKTDKQGMSICNQANPATITTSVSTQYYSVAPVLTSGGWLINHNVLIDPTLRGGTITNCVITTIDDASTNPKNISIFPNPTSGNFTINLDAEIQKGNLEIYNMLGVMIFKKQIVNESKIEINLKSVSTGIYLLKVFDHEKQYSHKIIIE